MSKLTTEKFNEYQNSPQTHATITLTILEQHMHKAEMLIDRYRLFNRRMGMKFVGHYCKCDEVRTYWFFVYECPANSVEADGIYNELRDIFTDVYKEEINAGEAGSGGYSSGSHDASPCVCPYSMR